MELLLKIIAGVVIGFVVLTVYSCMKMSSKSSRYEEYTINDLEDIYNNFGCSAIISNGEVESFIKE